MDDALLDELFAAPLDSFVSVRNELAARARDAGERSAAERIKALRKPSVPAWAVNRLARLEPEAIAELASIGERLSEAQAAVLSGGDPGPLHAARAAERDAVSRLAARAETVLAEAGFAPNLTRRERIANTLFAMAADPDARELIVRGRLTEELERVGFGDAVPLGAVPAPRAKAAAASSTPVDPEKARAEAEGAVARALRLRAEADRLASDAAQADRVAEEARSRANEARRAAERAASQADRADAQARAAAEVLAEHGGDAASEHDILGPDQGA